MPMCLVSSCGLNAQQRKTVNLVVAAQGDPIAIVTNIQLVDASQIALQRSLPLKASQ